MEKKNFVSLVMGTIAGILFAIGMCMALLPTWGAFVPGIVMGSAGLALLLATLIVRRRMEGKPPIRLTGKAVGTVALGVVGALGLGVGMCMTMVWSMLIPGIVVGIVGIALLMCMVPVVKGLK